MNRKIFFLGKALTILGLFFFYGCTGEKKIVHLKGATMGTHYNVKFLGASEDGDYLKPAIDQLLLNLNQEMSTYIKSSEISYFNNSARLSWVNVSEDFFHVTQYALSLAQQTKGVYDPTIGPLVNLWGFGPPGGGERKVPTDIQITEAKSRVGYEKVVLSSDGLKMKKTVPGVYLDLSSLAKGFGVDKVAQFLESQGISQYMVEIGGEVSAKGAKPKNIPWQIGIESVDQDLRGGKVQKILALKDTNLATSGNYRNFFKQDDKHYSHTLDSVKGVPVPNDLASVSVVDPRGCMQADALATALMAMGVEKAQKYAQMHKIAAYFIFLKSDDGTNRQIFASVESSEFKKLFEK